MNVARTHYKGLVNRVHKAHKPEAASANTVEPRLDKKVVSMDELKAFLRGKASPMRISNFLTLVKTPGVMQVSPKQLETGTGSKKSGRLQF